MSTFAVTDANQLLDAVNYALSNLGQNAGNGTATGNTVTINTQTGVIGEGGYVLSYLYRYITVRYATSADGAGLTTNPVGATYFGVYNNNSQTPPDASNPGNYQWTECTSALSGTNLLWYSTLGGRQIQFFVGTQASLPQPASNWAQVNNTTPTNVIDLDFVTATATLPLVVMTAYYNAANANVAPATPTGGTYDFGNLIFTAPSGWTNSIPANNTAFFSSQNQFQATSYGNVIVGPVDPWTTPVLTGKLGQDGANGTNGANGVSTYNYPIYQSGNSTPSTPTGGYYNFGTGVGTPPFGWSNVAVAGTGNVIYVSSTTVSSNIANANVAVSSWSTPVAYSGTGQQGPRGSMPMAYILTNGNPVGASDSTLNTWFAASPTGTPPGSNSAPVGTGFFPQTGDTAAFTNSGNSAQVAVLTYASNTSPNWTQVSGQVINGSLFVTGSVNSQKLNANDVYTLNLTGGTGQVGNINSGGFWMQASTGDARMAGNVYIGNSAKIGNNLTIGGSANIGNNLTIGANTYIGGNLTVAGLITGNGAGATLNANTVTTTTVVPQAITFTDYFQTPYNVMDIQPPVGNTIYYAGTGIFANCSSSGNLITTAPYFADLLQDQYMMVTGNVSVISGTGAFAAGTTVTSVVNNTQFRTSSNPTTPLSGATVKTLGTQAIYVRSFPGLYITTTASNQIVQLSLNGTVELDTVCTALAAGLVGSVQFSVSVYSFPYVPGSSIATNTGSYVYNQDFSSAYIYSPLLNQNTILTQPFSFSNIVASVPTAGTTVFTIAVEVKPLNGTFTHQRLAITDLAGSGTVLKNQ